MHELGIMTGVLQAVEESAKQAGSEKVLKISLSVGVMTEAIEDLCVLPSRRFRKELCAKVLNLK